MKKIPILLMLFLSEVCLAEQVIVLSPRAGDMTPTVRKAIEEVHDKHIKIIFEKGTYFFLPNYAYQKYCYITNHDNGLKNIVFPFVGFESVEIEGNGAELMFHGRELPFLFERCGRVSVSGIQIDWDIPFLFQGVVTAVNPQAGWREIKPATDGFSWSLKKGRILFPELEGFTFSSLGSTLPFEKSPKRGAFGAWDITSHPEKVERRPGGILRIYEHLKYYPPVGTILNSKGPKGENRYAPAFHITGSKNVKMDKVVVHHAPGMGFLFERTANITLTNSGVFLREGSPRVVSSTADATHFCNCRGDILVDHCRFENMLDDGTNVHGTYVVVDKVLNEHTLRYELRHFQQYGFDFAQAGDELWFIHSPDPARSGVGKVAGIKVINDHYVLLTTQDPLPAALAKGDLLENKTWNPTFTMRRCTIQNHRARNIVIKTPKKVIIEKNTLSSMMSSILFRGESMYWFESGAVKDVEIRDNYFTYCAYSGAEHAVLYITPRLGDAFSQKGPYDRNIRFVNNRIETFDNRVVWANWVKGLVIKGNTIVQTTHATHLYPNAAVFEMNDCRDIQIMNNHYTGTATAVIKADKVSRTTMKIQGNTGFNIAP